MSLATKQHTVGNSTRWEVDYGKWLLPGEKISSQTVTSASTTLTVDTVSNVLGKEVWFYTHGGLLGEDAVVTVTVTTTLSQTKIDTIEFEVTAP